MRSFRENQYAELATADQKLWHFLNQGCNHKVFGKAKLYAVNVAHRGFALFPSLAAISDGLNDDDLIA